MFNENETLSLILSLNHNLSQTFMREIKIKVESFDFLNNPLAPCLGIFYRIIFYDSVIVTLIRLVPFIKINCTAVNGRRKG